MSSITAFVVCVATGCAWCYARSRHGPDIFKKVPKWQRKKMRRKLRKKKQRLVQIQRKKEKETKRKLKQFNSTCGDVFVQGSDRVWMKDDDWLDNQVRALPAMAEFPHLIKPAQTALKAWRIRFNKTTWKRLFKLSGRDGRGDGAKERVLKELNECVPVIAYVLDAVSRWNRKSKESKASRESDSKITIVDLCSGFGILSMFLSEILPPEKVKAIVLIDKMWPLKNQSPKTNSNQISCEHLSSPGWPIALYKRKVNIKAKRELRQIHKYVFDRASESGPTIIIGIHLCGSLSNRVCFQKKNKIHMKYFLSTFT